MPESQEIFSHPLIACLPVDSWLRRWLAAWPMAECPVSFMLFTGLSMIGAVLGRKVYFDDDVHKLWPMLNLLLTGTSGVGKDTAAELGFKLVRSLPPERQPAIITGTVTPEKLHHDLEAQPHAVLFASELANFFSRQKYMEGMIPYTTELLNYKDVVERRTLSGDLITIINPEVTILGCSTPEWLQEQLPDSATTGGFLSRFFIVFEEHRRQRVAVPRRAHSKKQHSELLELRKQALSEFAEIVLSPPTDLVLDFEDYAAIDHFSQWYGLHQPVSGHLAPFAARAKEFLLRIAMLLALARGKSTIDLTDLQAAELYYKYSETRLQQVVVPFTPQGMLLKKTLEAVGDREVSLTYVKRAMRNYARSDVVSQLVGSLLESKDLTLLDSGKLKRVRTYDEP